MAFYLFVQGTFSPVWFYLLIVVWLLAMKCMAFDVTDINVDLGKAVVRAMSKHGISIATAVDVMGIDHSMFCKALRGEGYRNLALNHLVKLGVKYPEFFVSFTAELMWLVAMRNGHEIVESGKEMGHVAREVISGVVRRA